MSEKRFTRTAIGWIPEADGLDASVDDVLDALGLPLRHPLKYLKDMVYPDNLTARDSGDFDVRKVQVAVALTITVEDV